MKQPRPSAIEKFSPTLIEALAECSYRAAFKRDSDYDSLDRPNTFQTLGIIRHRTSEAIHRGALNAVNLSDVKNEIGELWDRIAEQEAERYASHWPSEGATKVSEWPGYQIARAKTRHALAETVKAFRNSKHRQTAPTIEKYFEDPVLGLYGKPDRVEHHFDGPVIVDIKTGRPHSKIKDSWRRQLLLYAHLVQKNSATLPKAIVIETANGDRLEETVTEEQIANSTREAKQLVERFNRHLHNPIELAAPSADNCQYCPYRIHCEPFWNEMNYDWPSKQVRGHISQEHGPGNASIVTIEPTHPTDWPTKFVHIGPLRETAPPNAREFRVVNADPTQDSNRLRIRHDSWTLIT